ncbi:hypothetical protein O7627_27625 [Solwaraspora sp. WMMD1047]|uniref:hypothetical protein n=1 Tax=Solwaraspora sp. WMMD1047 TaxID=3016102 RepID=UPI002415D584|nr:hypothetical protein [Solwaraspora sp. WMMD1047]MDG4833048.1 hypothetical protein [Solwaraspora sp. WMMD1047]
MTHPDPTSPQEPTPVGDDLREYLELVDQAVDAITDADVEADLAAVLARAGYGPPPVVAQPDLRMAEFELAALPDTIEATDLECELRATNAELDRLRIEVAAARRARRREMARLHDAVDAADAAELRAAEAQDRAQGAAVGAEAYVDTALDRAQEILDRARADAEQIVADARRQAEEITAAAAHRPASDLSTLSFDCGVPLPRRLPGAPDLLSGWDSDELSPAVRAGGLVAGLSSCLIDRRAATERIAGSSVGPGQILLISSGSLGKSTLLRPLVTQQAHLPALAGWLHLEAFRHEPLTDEWGSMSAVFAAADVEREGSTEPSSSSGRWSWAALRSAMRRAFAVPRLCGHEQTAPVTSAAGPESELPESAPLYQFGHILVLVYRRQSLWLAGDSDRCLTVADLVVDLPEPETGSLAHGSLCDREEPVNAQD